MASESGDAGSFDLTISTTTDPVANDLCADAEVLSSGSTVSGTNACALGEIDFCSEVSSTSHQVYYSYTNNTGSNADIDLTVSFNPATTGDASSISVEVLLGCGGTEEATYCDQTSTINETLECVKDGDELIFVIASTDGSEGNFNITVTATPNNVTNDECDDAEDIAINTVCEFFTVSVDNTDACSESFTSGTCSFDTDPVVWYSFTPVNDGTVTFQNITDINGVATSSYLGLFTDDCSSITAAAAGSGCVTTGTAYDIIGGTTYHIAFGSDVGGAFSFDMNVNETLVNDDPCDGGFTPVVLSEGSAYSDDNSCSTTDFSMCSGTVLVQMVKHCIMNTHNN
ncbi:MAG: hypothetical protein R2771_15775 [Saprospiraceae bacterium]